MSIQLIPATEADRTKIQNMACFYVYDMSRSCGDLPGWELPEDGSYTCRELSAYFTDKTRHPFLIRFKGELAGFALVNKLGSTPGVDWNMGEFFILAKFQGKGIGKQVGMQIFGQFPGVWEVMQIPQNLPAISFWKKTVEEFTQGDFQQEEKQILEPAPPHPMIVLKFESKLGTGGVQ